MTPAVTARLAAFSAKCIRRNNGCLEHQQKGAKGRKRIYGTVQVEGKTWPAHRLAWSAKRGPIPAGMLVCHRCDNPRCINVAHLFLGRPLDNVTDMRKKGREGRKLKVPRLDHELRPRSGQNPTSKLTFEQVRAVVQRLERGEIAARLAGEYGVHKTVISNIRLRKAYKNYLRLILGNKVFEQQRIDRNPLYAEAVRRSRP